MPVPEARPLIIHHGSCPDGFGAAWWLGRHLGDHVKVSAKYDEPAPVDMCAGRDVWIVDFCYPTDELEVIAGLAETLIVLDHHQTARGWMEATGRRVMGLRDFSYLATRGGLGDVSFVHEESMSGVGMVAWFVRDWKGTPTPEFLKNVQDRDLWRFSLSTTKPVMAAVMARNYTVDEWDAMWVTPLADLILEGEGINRFRDALIRQTLDTAFEIEVCGHTVWAAASPYTIGSDVAGELAKRKPELFGAYFIPKGDRIQWGLRSTPEGMDVAALAEQHGGGGHKHASGFTILAHATT